MEQRQNILSDEVIIEIVHCVKEIVLALIAETKQKTA